MLGNTQGAMSVNAGTAVFRGSVTAANNQGQAGVLDFIKATVHFKRPFTCTHRAPSRVVSAQSNDDSSSCLQVQNSVVVLRGSVNVEGSMQVACPYEGRGPCIFNGGAALSCDNSTVQFMSPATFSRNMKRSIRPYVMLWDIFDVGGGAWRLQACRVVASHKVRFLNNSAIGGGGAIHAQQGSSMVFAGGLELSGNSASLGGGVFLAGSTMQLTGGPMMCKGNIAGEQGACMYATASFWWEFDVETHRESLVVWNSSASCVQNNSIINGSMLDPAVGTYDTSNMLFNITDIGLAAIAFGGSRVRFLGAGHNFGNNHATGNNSCDIAVFPVSVEWSKMLPDNQIAYLNNNFTGGFACSGHASHHYATLHEAYNAHVEGDVCAASCTGDTCVCELSSKWSKAACKCV